MKRTLLERLGHESLDLAGAHNGRLICFVQLLHTEDRDDILQLLIALQLSSASRKDISARAATL